MPRFDRKKNISLTLCLKFLKAVSKLLCNSIPNKLITLISEYSFDKSNPLHSNELSNTSFLFGLIVIDSIELNLVSILAKVI